MKTTIQNIIEFSQEILECVRESERENIIVKVKKCQQWEILIKLNEMEIFIFENQSYEYNKWVCNMVKGLIMEVKNDTNI